jgi:probable HAF family extracellular repeat protein
MTTKILGLVVLSLLGGAVANAQTYKAIELTPLPGGDSTVGTAINNKGQVTGFGTDLLDGLGQETSAAIWNGTTPTLIAHSGGVLDPIGNAINNSGIVVGSLGKGGPIVWTPTSGVTSLPGDTFDGSANGINRKGQIVGYTDPIEPFQAVATLWSSPTATSATLLPSLPGQFASFALAINNSGTIAGYTSFGGNSTIATLWSGTSVIDLGTLGGANSLADAINSSGHIVGSADTAAGNQLATEWFNGTTTNLGTLGGAGSGAAGINKSGAVVGWADTASGAQDAALFVNGQVIDLNTYLSPAVAATVTLTDATGINNKGWIVVNGTNDQTGLGETFVLKPTKDRKPTMAPEMDPTSAASALALLLGSVMVLRGRKSHA